MPPALRPPQFSLRTLLLLVTAFAVLFGLANFLPPLMIAGLAFLLISIVAHVAGNAIGTRLREIGSQPSNRSSSDRNHAQAGGGAPRCAPRTELSRRRPLGWPVALVTVAGGIAAAVGGGIWTALLVRNSAAPLAICLAVAACGILGGLGSFLAFSFAQVGLGALRQSLTSGSHPADDVQHLP